MRKNAMSRLTISTTGASISIEEGFDFILSHFEPPLFPRMIATPLVGWKYLVHNRAEALARFEQCNLVDCRISAFPYPVPSKQVPNFLFIDWDRNGISYKALLKCLNQTLQNFKDRLGGATPTVIWSGGGFHLLQPMLADFALETVDIFAQYTNPSIRLLRYLEKTLTDNKADPSHTIAYDSCWIRPPGSFNSKPEYFGSQAEVRIFQKWDGYYPNIRLVLDDFWLYLVQEKNNEILDGLHSEQKWKRHRMRFGSSCIGGEVGNKIGWVEKTLATPLDDFRWNILNLIVIPYLVNVLGLSRSECFQKAKSWLDICSQKRRLDWNAEYAINYRLNHVGKYRNLSRERLSREKPQIYARLEKEGVFK